ncbi:hypothetical protein QM012_005952 [Aureobasidium pullulans]|uniref:Uncharacterized protein n=1 Tax=Aureobasidium pullulans TaxID=5580 RepID=A0ABR0TR63_AURPU
MLGQSGTTAPAVVSTQPISSAINSGWTGVFGRVNGSLPASVPSTACAPANNEPIHEHTSIQTGDPSPVPSVYASALPSDAAGVRTVNTRNRTVKSIAITAIHMQGDLTALTADDIAKFHLVHESRAKVTKLVKHNDHGSRHDSQDVDPIRILASKHNFLPRIIMRADPSGKVGLDSDTSLNGILYKLKAPRLLQFKTPTIDKKNADFSMCIFKDELNKG